MRWTSLWSGAQAFLPLEEGPSNSAWLVVGSIQAVLYGVRPDDALSFAGAGLLLLAVTAMAALLPAIRATHVDPSHVLRGN